MILTSRLCRPAHAAFDGHGGLVRDGRWHKKGRRVVYVASSEALAVLEALVHLTSFEQIPEYVCIKAHIPDELISAVESLGPLPVDWRSSNPTQARALGTKWLLETQSAVLRVPSVVIPREANYLLNPLHADFKSIVLETAVPFECDIRLLGKTPLE